jgi:hypothetical protein
MGDRLLRAMAGMSPDMSPYYGGQLTDAARRLFLSPQEKNLYEHHLQNLWGPTGVDNANGSRSTLYQMSYEGPDGRTYNVPTVWNGQILQPDAAWAQAQSAGLQNFPSYNNADAAEQRYQQIHNHMEWDQGADTDIRRANMIPNPLAWLWQGQK